MAGDQACLDPMPDDRFVATFDAGPLLDKPGFLKLTIDDWRDPARLRHLPDRQARVTADTVVVVETDTISGTDAGIPYSYDARVTAVSPRRAGGWKAVALHLVRKRGAS